MLLQFCLIASGMTDQDAALRGNVPPGVLQNRYSAALEDLSLRYRQYDIGRVCFDDAAEAVRRYAKMGTDLPDPSEQIRSLEYALNMAISIKIIARRRYDQKTEPLQLMVQAEELVIQLQGKMRSLKQ